MSFFQQDNYQLNLLKCSFCSEYFSKFQDFRQHSNSCGNKTDRCPNCQNFIRRADFERHYENNCATILDSNRSPEMNGHDQRQRDAVSRNRPISREDIVPDDNRRVNERYSASRGRPISSSSNHGKNINLL